MTDPTSDLSYTGRRSEELHRVGRELFGVQERDSWVLAAGCWWRYSFEAERWVFCVEICDQLTNEIVAQIALTEGQAKIFVDSATDLFYRGATAVPGVPPPPPPPRPRWEIPGDQTDWPNNI